MKHLILSVLVFAALVQGADVNVGVRLDQLSAARIEPQLFGSFYEEHWGDVTPGIFEQYLVNPSFETWYVKPGEENKTRLVFEPTPVSGIAYPWEPYASASGSFSQSVIRVNSELSQRVAVTGGARAGVLQRLALPDYRVTRYRLRLHARAEGAVTASAVLLDGSTGDVVLDTEPMSVGSDWRVITLELDLGRALTVRHLARFGVARLAIIVQGDGALLLDGATLYPVDAVDGLYNPETLANIRQFGPTAIRWPGGNFTSGYHWRDGIGPADSRPTRPNRAWGGLADNLVGTDEWLRFAEKVGLPVAMGVGFGEVTAEEAAEWVEYCNGGTATPLGALRAANGHPAPYNVKVWSVGNEVYGTYQIGYTDALTYSRGLVLMAQTMRQRDPSIQIVGVGYGVHNDYRSPTSDWNRVVLQEAGSAINFLDVHQYVYGPEDPVVAAAGAPTIQRAFLGASARLSEYYTILRNLLASTGQGSRVGAVHYEWGSLPRSGAVNARRQTFLNLLFTADLYHAMLRNADLVKGAMLHNFSYYVNPVRAHSEPPNPRTHILPLYRSLAGGQLATTSVTGPTYTIAADYPEFGPLLNIPEVDTLAVLTPDRILHICLLNRSLERSYTVRLDLSGPPLPSNPVNVERFESDIPTQPLQWGTATPVFRRTLSTATLADRTVELSVGQHSLVHLSLPVTFPPVVVTVAPARVTLDNGQVQQFTAPVTGTSNTAVTWALSQPIGSLSSTGLYAAPSLITNGTSYLTVTATSVADPSKSATASLTIRDTTAPTITSVQAHPLSIRSHILWTTNEPSDTQVEYGLTTAYGSVTAIKPNRITEHDIWLEGLARNTLYNYRVKSRDRAGHLAVSGNFTFRTNR